MGEVGEWEEEPLMNLHEWMNEEWKLKDDYCVGLKLKLKLKMKILVVLTLFWFLVAPKLDTSTG